MKKHKELLNEEHFSKEDIKDAALIMHPG